MWRAQIELLHGEVKAGGAVDAIAVEQGHGGNIEVGGGLGVFFGQGGALQEAESGAGVEFDIHIRFLFASATVL